MGLRADAARDFRLIAENLDEFGISAEVRSPTGQTATLVGLSSDVALALDANTGATVSAPRASVSFAFGAFTAAGLPLPTGPKSPAATPWKLRIQEPGASAPVVYAITETIPDASIAGVTCILKRYDGSF